MDGSNKISNEYKKAFNLGYELAKELGLRSPMFKSNNIYNSPSNAIEDGMLQFISEMERLKKLDIDRLTSQDKKRNTGKGLTP